MRTLQRRIGILLVAFATLAGGGLGARHAAAAPPAQVTAAQQTGAAQGADGETADSGSASETADAGNGASGGDELVDGIRCQQQGDYQGENVGC